MKNLSYLKYTINKFILVLLMLGFASVGFGQQLDFIRRGIMTNSAQYAISEAVTTDAAGNIYVTGYFEGSITFGSYTLTGATSSYTDIFIVKYNSSGTVLWAKRAGGIYDDNARAIAVKDGYVYICGSFYDSANFNTPSSNASNTITSAAGSDMLLAKYDDAGNFIWAKRAGGDDLGDAFTSITVTDSNIYVSGEFRGTKSVNFNNPSATGSNEVTGNGNTLSIFVAKYDFDGNFVWVRSAGGSLGTTHVDGIAASGDDIYLTGTYQGTMSFDDSGVIVLAAGAQTGFLAKYQSNGDFLWARRMTSTGNLIYNRAISVYNSKVYLTGVYTKTATFGNITLSASTAALSDTYTQDIFVASYNANGDVAWAKRAGGLEELKVNSGLAIATTEKGVFIGGHFSNPINFNTPHIMGMNELDNSANILSSVVAKFDHSGNYQWSRRSGGSTGTRSSIYGIALSGSNVYATGVYNGTINFNTPSSAGTNEITSVGSFPGEVFLTKYIDADAPKINVKGNSNWVVNGSTAPAISNNTDFGTQSVLTSNTKTFNITNTGTIPLNLSGSPKVVISGTNAADFTVTTQPDSPLAATTGASTFQISFTPSEAGIKTATVSIANDDTDENPYTFSIQGTGQANPVMSAFAQDFAPKPVTNNFITISDNLRPALALTDIDRDGLKDLFVGNSNGQLSHYEQSAANSTTFTLQTSTFNSIDVGDNSAPAFTDLDGDGLLDLLIGNETGRLFHYEQSAANSTTFTLVSNFFSSIDVGTTATPVVTDLDGDGLLDLISGKTGGQLAHYEQASANSLTFTLVTSSFNSIDVGGDAAPTMTDVDGDGLLDLIVGSDVGKFFHYEQDAANATTFTLVTNTYAAVQEGVTADVFGVFGDFDNDGMLDMLWGNSTGTIKHGEQEQGSVSCFSTSIGTPSATQALKVFGKGLQSSISVNAPTGYQVSLSESSGFGSSVSIPASNGKILNTTVYVRFNPSTSGIITGNLTVSSTNATSYTFPLTNIIAPYDVINSNNFVCEGSSVALVATCPTGTIQWYAQATGGTSIGTGTPFYHAPTTTTSYYASCKDGSCESSRTLAGTVGLLNKPAAPTGATGRSICAGNTASLTASCAGGNTISWYNSSSSTLLFTGSNFVTPTLTANTTYNVRCEGTSCNSNFVVVNVTLNSTAATATEIMTWTGTVNNNWANGCNWTPNGIPTITNQVVIPNTTNDPVIYSGTNAVAQRVVLRADALLTNNTGATLSVSDTVNSFNIEARATFTNNGTTTASNTALVGLNKTTITIAAGGIINNYGTMTVNGNLNYGLYFTGTFNNKTGAVLNSSGSTAILMASLGKLTNESGATINANGTTNGVVFGGISVSSTNSGTLNTSKIEIIDGTSVSNQACAVIKTTGNFDMSGSSNFQNAGYTYIGAQLGFYGGAVTNTGVLTYNTLIGSRTITNNYLIVNNAVPIFSYGNSFNGAINGIFTDANAATPAGTFIAPNTFTPSGLPQTSQTLYAKITPSGGACSYIVPFIYDNTSAINVTAALSTFAGCSGTASTAQSFTVSGTSLNEDLTITAPTGFEIATSEGGTYSASLTLTPSSGTVASTTIYVRLKSTATGSVSGNITFESGSTLQNIAVSGTVTTLPTSSISYAGNPFCKNASPANVTRTGTAGGAFTASPVGLSINGSSGQITPASSTAGIYTVNYTIAASGGCPAVTATASVTINEVSAPTINAPGTKIVCSPGTLTLTASGCAGTINWSNGGSGTSITLSSVGTYSITATCTVGSCTSPASAAVTGLEIITQPAAPTINAPGTKVVCAPGTLTLTASGCAGTVNWSNGGSGTSITLSSVGTYSIIATCTVGSCTSPASAAITGLEIIIQPSAPTINTPTPKVVCAPSPLTLTASGCAGTVNWSNGGSGTSITLSSVGTYSIAATCTVGSCTSPASAAVTGLEIIAQPSAPTINAPGTKVVCAPGTLTLTASGCAGIVNWSNGGSGTSITLSSVGTYSITATCTVGSCTSPASTAVTGLEIITQPSAPTIYALGTKVVCAPGTLTLTASGCAGTVNWSNGGSGTSITLSSVGTYSITATCTVGSCTSPASAAVTGLEIITQPAAPSINAPGTKVVCSPGTLILTASGCAGTVNWSNGGSGTSITLSSVGTYSITATCTVGSCTSPTSAAVTGLEIITQPAAPTINAPGTKVVCAPGTLTLTASGCAGTVTWSNGGSGTSITLSSVGTYSITATCTVGSCTSPASTAVTGLEIITQPSAPSINAPNPKVVCAPSTLTLTASGCAGTVNWSNGGSGTSITLSSVGTYSITATCTVGSCTSPSSTAITGLEIITQPVAPTINAPVTKVVCSPSTLTLTASGCAGTVNWSNGGSGTSITLSSVGTYSITAACTVGSCTSPASTAVTGLEIITQPSAPSINTPTPKVLCAPSTLTLTASGCAGTVNWSNGGSGTSITLSNVGTYSITATCTVGSCTSPASTAVTGLQIITQPSAPSINAPNPKVVCSPSTLTLTASGCAGTINWSNGGSGTSITLSSVGTYSITATCTVGSCTSSASTAVTGLEIITQPSAPSINTPTPKVVCAPSTLTLTASGCAGTINWSNGGSGTSITLSSVGTYSIIATCTVGSCTSPASTTVTGLEIITQPSAPSINAPNPKVVCSPSTLTLTASGCAGTVNWSNGGSGTSITLSSVGTYSITATCTVGSCTSPSSTAITGLEIITQPVAPTINAPVTKVVCSPSTLTLTASGCAGTVNWSNGASGTSITLSSVGTYSITATCTVGSCTSSASAAVTGLEIITQPVAPTINTPTPKVVCAPGTLTLTASGCAGTVNWSNGGSGTSITLSSVGTYSIIATCTVGSCTSPASTAVTGLQIITQPSAPSINAPNPKVVCSPSTLTLTASGCAGTVNWSNGGSGTSITLSSVGTYSITATCTVGSCTSPTSAAVTGLEIITQPVAPNINAPGTKVVCSPSTLTLTASGCAGTVNWSNGGSGTSITLSSVGTYSITATCTVGSCTSPSSTAVTGLEIITQPSAPTINAPGTKVVCSPSTLTLTASGCAGTVNWSNGGSGTSITLSSVGTYSITATCTVGSCTSPTSAAVTGLEIITQPAAPTINAPDTKVVCAPGTLTLTASGCAGTVTWSNGGSGTSITLSSVGTYSITATCTVGSCTSPASTAVTGLEIITQPSAPTINAPGTKVVCAPGTLTLTASGCAGTVNWSNGGSGTSITLSSVGTYSITATCTVGSCTSPSSTAITGLEIITQPVAPTINAPVTKVVCSPSTLTLTASGCAGTVNWSNGASGTSITLSSVGTYSITATCTVGSCTSPASTAVTGLQIITQPSAPSINAPNPKVVCSPSTLTLTASGCAGTVNWSNGGSGTSITLSLVGTYSITATCTVGSCTSPTSAAVTGLEIITQPSAPSINAPNPKVVCSPSTLTLTASGCAGTVNWSNGGSGTSITLSSVGTYSIMATCTVGSCTSPTSAAVTGLEIITQPSAPTINAPGTKVVCAPGTLTLTASGCAGTVNWSNGGSGTSITLSSVGTYSITATCTVGSCTSPASTAVTGLEIITQPVAPTINTPTSKVVCAPGTLALTASGCAGTVTWSNGGSGTSITLSSVGTYSITATCTVGSCTSPASTAVTGLEIITQPVAPTINTPTPKVVCAPGTLTLTASGCAGTVTWSNGGSGTSITLSSVGTYSITATCTVGSCTSPRSAAVTGLEIITQPSAPSINAPNPKVVCSPSTLTLTASGCAGTVNWSNGGSGTSITLSSVGTYSITATCTVGNCISNSSTVVNGLEILSRPNPVASNTGSYKTGDTIELTASGGSAYSWSGPDGFNSNLAAPTIPSASANNSGIYTVVVSNGVCSATATTQVIVTGTDPCNELLEYQLVKAGNPYQPLFNITDGMLINQLTEPVSIIAVPVCPTRIIESLNMEFRGPSNSITIIQSVSPYTIFDNLENNVYGRLLTPGTYTLTVTGYSQDNLQGSINYGPVTTTFTILPTTATINTPTLAKSVLCSGSNIDVTFSTSGTFNVGNQFRVELSDANGRFGSVANVGNQPVSSSFVSPTIIGTSNTAGTVNCTIPSGIDEGANYRIRVVSTNGVSVSNASTSALTIYPRNLSFVSPADDYTGNVGIKQASQKITATNKVKDSAVVSYQAGRSIELQPGFSANSGTIFRAEIQGCSN